MIELKKKHETLTRGIRHGWVCADSTSRISSQPQFRSDWSDSRLTATTSYHHRWQQM